MIYRLVAFFACLLAVAAPVAAAKEDHTSSHRYAPPDPDSLGGSFALRDLAGRTVTAEGLRGRWNIVYFGYSRCTDTCPVALPRITAAAQSLKSLGTPARAIFVDIEAPPGTITPRNPEIAVSSVGHHPKAASAAKRISDAFGPSLLVLSGSRSQLNAATVAFQVRREHIPARPAEDGHSINHTSFIYLMSPDGRVAGYVYHDADPAKIVEKVRGFSTPRS